MPQGGVQDGHHPRRKKNKRFFFFQDQVMYIISGLKNMKKEGHLNLTQIRMYQPVRTRVCFNVVAFGWHIIVKTILEIWLKK